MHGEDARRTAERTGKAGRAAGDAASGGGPGEEREAEDDGDELKLWEGCGGSMREEGDGCRVVASSAARASSRTRPCARLAVLRRAVHRPLLPSLSLATQRLLCSAGCDFWLDLELAVPPCGDRCCFASRGCALTLKPGRIQRTSPGSLSSLSYSPSLSVVSPSTIAMRPCPALRLCSAARS